jgi:hypothetical protein
LVSGVSFKSSPVSERLHNKDSEDNVRKFHQKKGPDPGPEIRKNSSQIRTPDPEGKKHRIPDPQHWFIRTHRYLIRYQYLATNIMVTVFFSISEEEYPYFGIGSGFFSNCQIRIYQQFPRYPYY